MNKKFCVRNIYFGPHSLLYYPGKYFFAPKNLKISYAKEEFRAGENSVLAWEMAIVT